MRVNVTANASGAAAAAQLGDVVLIVDVISMSTSLESALDAGALAVWGAAPDNSRAPVALNPQRIGRLAGEQALQAQTGIVVLSEPRTGTAEQLRQTAGQVLLGLREVGVEQPLILPNLGSEVVRLANFEHKVVIAVTDCGGAAFDAAFTAGAPAVVCGTVARTAKQKGWQPAMTAAARAVAAAGQYETNITVVAASANAVEDLLAAECIARQIYQLGVTALKQQ